MKELLKQGGFYIFAGVSAALIELALFTVLNSFTGLGIASANIISVVVATAYNFTLNRSVTFKSTSNPARSAVLYTMLFAINLAITTFAIGALTEAGLQAPVAKLIMQVCVAVWNFVLYKRVIFK